jgi:hypothetical protein
MSLSDIFLSFVGLATAESRQAAEEKVIQISKDWEDSQDIIADLRQQLSTVRSAFSSSNNENAQLKEQSRREQSQREWCSPQLVEFPVETPPKLHHHSLLHQSMFVPDSTSLFDLTIPAKFRNTQQWALYWCLAHASHAAVTAAKAAKSEDGISRTFLDELKTQAKKLPTLTGEETRLQIAYNAIFEQNEPAMKEAAVGADILLVIAGQSIIPNGFARIFWIQAKKASGGAFSLQYYRSNNNGLQVDALAKVHQPENGSFGLYTLYSKELAYIPSVFVNKLLPTEKYVADMSAIGTRMSELLVSCTSNFSDVGAFAGTDDLLAYLDEVSDMKPLYVVTITEEGREYSQKRLYNQLLSTISDYYEEKLGLRRDVEHKPGRSPGHGR